MERMRVPPAIEGSWDSNMHKQSNGSNRLLILGRENKQRNNDVELLLATAEGVKIKKTRKKRGQRAIGVVYNPEYERYGNYVPTNLAKRYDAFLFVDKT